MISSHDTPSQQKGTIPSATQECHKKKKKKNMAALTESYSVRDIINANWGKLYYDIIGKGCWTFMKLINHSRHTSMNQSVIGSIEWRGGRCGFTNLVLSLMNSFGKYTWSLIVPCRVAPGLIYFSKPRALWVLPWPLLLRVIFRRRRESVPHGQIQWTDVDGVRQAISLDLALTSSRWFHTVKPTIPNDFPKKLFTKDRATIPWN